LKEVIMEKFIAGIARFQNEVFPRSRHLYEQLAEGQQPETLHRLLGFTSHSERVDAGAAG
jgi:hypothetical protein